jgi:hypothetical protein
MNEGKLLCPETSHMNWAENEPKPIGFTAILPATLPDRLKVFADGTWSAALEIPITVVESGKGHVDGAQNFAVELWAGKLSVPLKF